MFCECGCGGVAPIARQSETKRGYVKGRPHRFIGGHNWRRQPRDVPGVYKQRYTPDWRLKVRCEHVIIAERVLGKPLPSGAVVHHVDGDTRNNAAANLVICQDAAYHRLLHYRAKVKAAGGDPNADKVCRDCSSVKPLTAFNAMRSNKSSGRQSICRACSRARDRRKRARRSEAA